MATTATQGYDLGVSLLRVTDVMERLAISRNGIYRLIATGALTPVYLDDRPRFVASEVAELIEERRLRNRKE